MLNAMGFDSDGPSNRPRPTVIVAPLGAPHAPQNADTPKVPRTPKLNPPEGLPQPVKDTARSPLPCAEADATALPTIDSKTFSQQAYPRHWLIDSVLVADQLTVLGGPKKSLKTSVAVDLAISLGTGTPFLGKFPVPQKGRVVILSGESGGATLKETAQRICHAKKQQLEEALVFWGFKLPQLDSERGISDLDQLLQRTKPGVLIIDALYLCLIGIGSGVSATNLYSIGPVLMRMADICLERGTTPIIIHHSRKGKKASGNNPGKLLELEDLAFAGVQEIARQWILLNRRQGFVPGSGRHPLWMSIGGSAGHSSSWAVDIEEGQLSEQFTRDKWEVVVKTVEEMQADLPVDAAAQGGQANQQRRALKRDKILEFLRLHPEGETMTSIRTYVGGEKGEVTNLLTELAQEGSVIKCQVTKPGGNGGNKNYPGWQLVQTPAETVNEAGGEAVLADIVAGVTQLEAPSEGVVLENPQLDLES